MKTPISVHALYHISNVDSGRIYTELYTLLCRDIKDPFSDGLDIPVYYCAGDDEYIPELAQSGSDFNLYLLFVDINMFCSKAWRDRISELIDRKDENTTIVCVKQYSRAFSINKRLGEIQSIVIDPDPKIEEISLFAGNYWNIFVTRLFDLMIRVLKGENAHKPLQVFISHTKKGNLENGENYAQGVRSFLASDTKLASFFDVHDILDGYDFGEQIKYHAANSLLLILFTNTYSSREWCRIEVLTAKEKKVPIVAVSMLSGNVDRVFPYIGNVPSTIFKGDWREVINLLLRTALDQSNETKMLSTEIDDCTDFLPYPPEALNMSFISTTITKVLYPEPPLGNEELHVLNEICQRMERNVKFTTPMSHRTENANLHEAKIGISISESPNLQELGIGKEMFTDLTIELSRHILKANGRMIYGGDLRKDGFTELFRDLSFQYGQKEKEEANVVYFENYLSWPLYNTLTKPVLAKYLESRIKLIKAPVGEKVNADEVDIYVVPASLETRVKWACSLTAMRKEIIKKSDARIVVGGKLKGFTGYMAGVVEEFLLSIRKTHPIFLIGGFGGAAQMIGQIIEGQATSKDILEVASLNPDYKELYDFCEHNGEHIEYEALDGISFDNLNNGLTPEQNHRLLHSVDIIEIVSLVIEGLNNVINHEA